MLRTNGGYWIPDIRSGAYFKRIDSSGLPQGCGNRVTVCRKISGKPWRTVIDGGAFVGSWTLHLAKVATRVLAFEPMPDNFECLKRNLAHKGECRAAQRGPDRQRLHAAPDRTRPR